MAAEWCDNPEPHGEHYAKMAPGYDDLAPVCFGRAVVVHPPEHGVNQDDGDHHPTDSP